MKRLNILLSSSFLVFSLYAHAGSGEQTPDSINNSSRDLPDLEVVSQKESTSITSPTPFHKINAKAIIETGITDISDALKRLPGVNLRDYGGAGGLKTVSIRGLGAQHTGVSYDGVALSDLQNGQIDLSRYSLNNIEALSLSSGGDSEEIFQPARNAAAASLISISAIENPDLWEKQFKLDSRLKFGSFGLINPFFNAGYSNGTNFSIAATGEFYHAKNDFPFELVNGDYVSKERRTHSRMNSLHSEINAIFNPTSSSSLNAKLYCYDNSRQLPGPVIYYVADSNEHLHERNFFSQLRYRNKLSSIFSLLALAKFNWATSHYEDFSGSYPGGKLDQNYIQRETYASVALLCLPSSQWAIDYSADWFFNNLSSNLPSDRHPYRNSILQSISAKYSIGPLSAMGRLLYSIYLDRSSNNGNEEDKYIPFKNKATRLSPSFSVSVRPIASLPFFVRTSYKNIFRMPTFNELYFDNYGTVSLKPETTEQWNLGLTFSASKSSIFNDLSITLDGYINEVRNKIVAIPYNLFKWTMTNLGKVRIYGLDVTLNSEIMLTSQQSLLIAASYTYQRSQPRTSPDMLDWMKQVAYTPLNSGATSFSWLNPWVSLAIHATGSSARYTTNANLPATRLAGYADFGVSLFHNFILKTGSLEIRADLINLFDKQYQIVARYPMPGRNWSASVRYTF